MTHHPTAADTRQRERRLRSMYKAAKYAGLGYGTIREMVHLGKLRLIVLPGRKAGVVDLDDLDRVIDETCCGVEGHAWNGLDPQCSELPRSHRQEAAFIEGKESAGLPKSQSRNQARPARKISGTFPSLNIRKGLENFNKLRHG